MIYNTLHRNLKIEQHDSHTQTGGEPTCSGGRVSSSFSTSDIRM